ncbi:BTB/POZ domain-containing protein 6-B-like [Contarinia nasturtii]|uniref:BTB/POZ domain-containing protein 6-B-like n=1 Tax=Contarinia nasturtii TaxID=265458 RepID=UPI0012D46A3C|nr:BTB/POZ domain-containing protein 6-B-like [Contarinia nasturtii]
MTSALYNSAASETTKKLYLNAEFADINFLFKKDDDFIDATKLPANKAILAVLSPVFNTMFYGSMKEKGDVKIVDADVNAFKEFLQFFYLTEVKLTMENIEAVARLADKYDIIDCVNACATFLEGQLTMDNMIWGYQLAVFLKNDALIEFCEKKIGESPKTVFVSDAFLRCDKQTLEHILELNLTCSELDIFNACLIWAKHACNQNGLDENNLENFKVQLGDCLKSIRFDEMKIDEFTMLYVSYKALFTADEFEDIMLSLTVKEYKPKIFIRNPRRYTWNRDRILYCKRKCTSGIQQKALHMPERVSFTSNNPLLLGEINTFSLVGSYNYDMHSNSVKITITELESHTFHSNSPKKILYEGIAKSWINNQMNFTLPEPILIKPQILYEIQLELSCYFSFSSSILKPIVEMDGELIIHFHRNPSLDYDNSCCSWVSQIGFNRI